VSSEGDDEDPQATIKRQHNAERLARMHRDFMGNLQSNGVTASLGWFVSPGTSGYRARRGIGLTLAQRQIRLRQLPDDLHGWIGLLRYAQALVFDMVARHKGKDSVLITFRAEYKPMLV
jgi:hypothetical protein